MLYLTARGRWMVPRYKYSGADHSLLYKYFLSPFAAWCVERLTPMWMAPNLITFLGLLGQVAAGAILCYYCPTFTEQAPAWAIVLGAAALFVYSTMDNMDGKQARRTGTSSALGLLFDHGCDAINAGLLGPLILAMATQGVTAGGSGVVVAAWACATIPFFFSTWEEMHTRTFVLAAFNGPNEGIATTIVALLYTAGAGSDLWRAAAADSLPRPIYAAMRPALDALRWLFPLSRGAPPPASPYTNLEVFAAFTLFVLVAGTVAISVWTVAVEVCTRRVASTRHVGASNDGGASNPGPRVSGLRGLVSAAASAWPMALLFAAVVAWMHDDVLRAAVDAHLGLFLGAAGAAFSLFTSAMMLAHVADQPPGTCGASGGLAALALQPLLRAAAAGGWFQGAPDWLRSAANGNHAAAVLGVAATIAFAQLAHFSVVATAEVADALDIDILDTRRQRELNAAVARRVAQAEAARRAASPVTSSSSSGDHSPDLRPRHHHTPAAAPASQYRAWSGLHRASSPAARAPPPPLPPPADASPGDASAFVATPKIDTSSSSSAGRGGAGSLGGLFLGILPTNRSPTVADFMAAFTPFVTGGGGREEAQRRRHALLLDHGSFFAADAVDPSAFAAPGADAAAEDDEEEAGAAPPVAWVGRRSAGRGRRSSVAAAATDPVAAPPDDAEEEEEGGASEEQHHWQQQQQQQQVEEDGEEEDGEPGAPDTGDGAEDDEEATADDGGRASRRRGGGAASGAATLSRRASSAPTPVVADADAPAKVRRGRPPKATSAVAAAADGATGRKKTQKAPTTEADPQPERAARRSSRK